MAQYMIELSDDEIVTLKMQTSILRRRGDINLVHGCYGGDLLLSIADQVIPEPIQVGDRVEVTNWGSYTYTVKYIDDQVAFLAEDGGGHSWDFITNLTKLK